MIDDDDMPDSGPIFVFQDDPECKSETKLKDLDVGESFIFMGNRFRKINTYGWTMGFMNIEDVFGNRSHLHPTTRVSLIQ